MTVSLLLKPISRSFACVLLSAGVAGLALAQSSPNSEKAMKSLSAHSQEVVTRLGGLSQLPPTSWKCHSGDVAHGEDQDLDDTSWKPLEVKTKPSEWSEYPKEALWCRSWIEVPETLHGYSLSGTRIWFNFHAAADDAMPEIIYFNGRRVALGEDLEPIVLFDKAKPGEKALVAVKLLQTTGTKYLQPASLKIDFAANRPNPEDFRSEILSAALLIPSLTSDDSSKVPGLDKTLEQVDLKALDSHDQQRFDTSLTQAQQSMNSLSASLKQFTFHLTGNSHIDAAWLWPWTETVDAVKRTFGTALQLMNEYPEYTYTQSAAQYNDWLAEKYPDMNDQIKQRIKDGRWEIVGGMWVEPDLNMPDGESQVRTLLIGKRWYQQHYGVDVRIGWNPDSFGYNWQLPQIYKKSGIDYFVTQKMSWNDTNHLPLKLFWWESPDGSKVLTYFPHGYDDKNLEPVHLSSDLVQARKDAPGMTEMMDLYGVGDHGGGPTRAMLDEGTHWAHASSIVPNFKFGTATAFFGNAESKLASESKTWNYDSIAKGYTSPDPVEGKISIPTWKDELYLEYHRGVFTTQADHKRNMRDSEEWALNAEKYASLAWLDGKTYPSTELTEAWKKITFNDFHDLAAGSGVGVIYKDAQRDFDQVHWATNEISQDALKTLVSRIDTSAAGKVPVVVFNPLAWERSGVFTVDVQMPEAVKGDISIVDNKNHVIPSEVLSHDASTGSYKLLVKADHVPSLGYTVLNAVPGKREFVSDLKASGLTLENTKVRVAIDAHTGCITSLYDKASKAEILAPGSCGNELEAFKDTPKNFDAWNIDPGTLDQPPTKLNTADSVEVVEKSPLRAVIRVTRTWQKSKFVQNIILYTGADQVEVENDIDWHETHVLLKSAFALKESSPKATYEIPYGTIERPTTRDNSWEKARFEVPALRWADLGSTAEGLSLINESKYGYDATGNILRLSLLRSPISPDPDADREHHHFSYALYPHSGDWKQALTVRHGYEFNYKLAAMQAGIHAGEMPLEHSYVSVKPENVVLTALKKAEDSDGLIFRVYEWKGKEEDLKIQVPPGATDATVVNLLEKPEGDPIPVANGEMHVPIHPYEILTIRVHYPNHAQGK